MATPSPRYSEQPDVVTLLNANATYETIYRRQLWVYVCTNKIARSLASLPLKVYEGEVEGEREYAPRSAPAKVLRRPYPRARTYQLILSIVGHLCVYGNATCVKFRGGNGRTPAQLWPMPWRNVEVIQGSRQPIDGYVYTANGVRKVFHPDDVVHFTWFNPNPDQPWGVSPIEPLATTLVLENAGQRYAISSFGNAARPASFIASERNLSKKQRDELRDEINAAYGGPENAFKVALLDNGLDWRPLGGSASDAQLVDNRKLSREEVCAAFDIPPPMVGILDHATYSNIDKQHWMLYQDTFAPWCEMLEDTLMAQVIDNEPAWDGFFVKFDLDAKLRGNYDQRSTSHQRQLLSGAATPNELRRLEDREPIDDPAADAIYVPANLVAVSADMRKLQDAEKQDAMAREDQIRQEDAAAAATAQRNGSGSADRVPTPAR